MNSKQTKVTVVDFQVLDQSPEIHKEIRDYWADNEFGNDHYYDWIDSVDEWVSMYDDDAPFPYPNLRDHLLSLKIEGPILIHWWW